MAANGPSRCRLTGKSPTRDGRAAADPGPLSWSERCEGVFDGVEVEGVLAELGERGSRDVASGPPARSAIAYPRNCREGIARGSVRISPVSTSSVIALTAFNSAPARAAGSSCVTKPRSPARNSVNSAASVIACCRRQVTQHQAGGTCDGSVRTARLDVQPQARDTVGTSVHLHP